MSWARIDDGFLTHPKAMNAGIEGRALFVASILYCSRERTDGQLTEMAVEALAGLAGVKQAAKVAERLVKVGLWDRIEGFGYQVHDYLEYNPSREEVEEKRQKAREAGARGARSRWGERDSRPYGQLYGETPSKPQGEPQGEPHGEPHGQPNGENMAPYPLSPSVDKSTSLCADDPAPKPRRNRATELDDAFLEELQAEEPTVDIRALASDYLNWVGSKKHSDKRLGLRNQLKLSYKRDQFRRAPQAAPRGFTGNDTSQAAILERQAAMARAREEQGVA